MSAAPDPSPEVAILMCTYNGARYLPEQLASFTAQTHREWSLHVSDDGSTDTTYTLLGAYNAAHPGHPLMIHEGPRQGFVRNFLSLAARAKTQATYFAFADQDDIWESDKLARAVAWLTLQPPAIPALYCARTLYVSEANEALYPSDLFARPPSFRNALVQSIAGANTMVFNQATRALLARFTEMDIPSHDWLTYLLVTGVGGSVHYDPVPCLRYRQHAANLLGQNVSFAARLVRARGLLAGKFREWNAQNLDALERISSQLTPENRAILARFTAARLQPLAYRLAGFYRSRIHRQTALGNLGLVIAALTNRI